MNRFIIFLFSSFVLTFVAACNADSDDEGELDSLDECPLDPNKTQPGVCGCGKVDQDSDSDNTLDCNDSCPWDPNKVAPGQCGCGTPEGACENCRNTLPALNQLDQGEYLCSPSGTYRFGLSSDGDLVLTSASEVVWSAGVSGGIYAKVQGDGNFLVKDAAGNTLWKTQTVGYSDAILEVRDDGQVVLLSGNSVLWSVRANDITDLCPNDPDKTTPGLCGCGIPEGTCDSNPCGDEGLTAGGSLESGPLVGYTSHNSAMIWAYAPHSNDVKVRYFRHDCVGGSLTASLNTQGAGEASVTTITGLSANTTYGYIITEDGRKAAEGSFRTAPATGKAVRFIYVFGSGVSPRKHPDQPAWDEVIDLNPSFQIFGGDNVYSNTTDYSGIFNRHLQQRAIKNYAKAIRTIPTFALWDDHDYGPNNSDGHEPGKENSLRAFRDLWPSPQYGTASTPGVFQTFHWGDVQFFMIDNRYHKMDGRYVGTQQMDWLKQELLLSSATFKIIVHGGTIRRAGSESWFEYSSKEKNELLNFIKENKITGILFNGGDVHNNIYSHYPKCPDGGTAHYDVFEIISSGWTYKSEFVHLEVDTTGTPSIKYWFHEKGSVKQIGHFTLESDGRMKHEFIKNANEPECDGGEPDPAYAFPD